MFWLAVTSCVLSASSLGDARRDFDALRFSRVSTQLAAIEARSRDLTRKEVIDFYEMQAVTFSVLGDPKATKAFTTLLSIEPNFQLGPTQRAPKVTTPFYEAKATMHLVGALALTIEQTTAGPVVRLSGPFADLGRRVRLEVVGRTSSSVRFVDLAAAISVAGAEDCDVTASLLNASDWVLVEATASVPAATTTPPIEPPKPAPAPTPVEPPKTQPVVTAPPEPPTQPTAPAADVPQAPTPPANPIIANVALEPTAAVKPAKAPPKPIAGWLALWGGALFVAGTVFGILSATTRAPLTDHVAVETTHMRLLSDVQARNDAVERANTFATMANIGFIAGGAVLVGALVTWLVSLAVE